jgi:hypothetical protein
VVEVAVGFHQKDLESLVSHTFKQLAFNLISLYVWLVHSVRVVVLRPAKSFYQQCPKPDICELETYTTNVRSPDDDNVLDRRSHVVVKSKETNNDSYRNSVKTAILRTAVVGD